MCNIRPAIKMTDL